MQCNSASSKSHVDFIAQQRIRECKSIPAWLSEYTLEFAEYIELPRICPSRKMCYTHSLNFYKVVYLKVLHSAVPQYSIISKESTIQYRGGQMQSNNGLHTLIIDSQYSTPSCGSREMLISSSALNNIAFTKQHIADSI